MNLKQMEPIKASNCKEAFAEPGKLNLIDLINPHTGRSCIEDETLEQIRERYPTAQVVNVDEWMAAKAARQNTPVTWVETTEEIYNYMLEVLPPAYMRGDYFMVGEPADHCAATGRARYEAFGVTAGRYVQSSRPMTIKEFKEFLT
jgi:uncharacterized protein DUF1419